MNPKTALLEAIRSRTVLSADGNKDLAEVASDILNRIPKNNHQIAEDCELSPSTVKRVRELNRPYNPNASTIEKIMRSQKITLHLR